MTDLAHMVVKGILVAVLLVGAISNIYWAGQGEHKKTKIECTGDGLTGFALVGLVIQYL